MNYELLEQIIKWASSILSICVFLFTTILFIINKIKAKHKRVCAEEENEELQEKLEDQSAVYKLVNEIIPLAIKKAEEMPFIDGPTKKLLAMSEILLSCNADGIDFEMYKDFISEQIEALIEFSKTINKRKE
ncbi:MAG: hypothetical protein IJO25_02455 [Clostridia bacterium]|nr:hypothetical protein [Clostridia bacterium]